MPRTQIKQDLLIWKKTWYQWDWCIRLEMVSIKAQLFALPARQILKQRKTIIDTIQIGFSSFNLVFVTYHSADLWNNLFNWFRNPFAIIKPSCQTLSFQDSGAHPVLTYFINGRGNSPNNMVKLEQEVAEQCLNSGMPAWGQPVVLQTMPWWPIINEVCCIHFKTDLLLNTWASKSLDMSLYYDY